MKVVAHTGDVDWRTNIVRIRASTAVGGEVCCWCCWFLFDDL